MLTHESIKLRCAVSIWRYRIDIFQNRMKLFMVPVHTRGRCSCYLLEGDEVRSRGEIHRYAK
jgi:hypothetical protein